MVKVCFTICPMTKTLKKWHVDFSCLWSLDRPLQTITTRNPKSFFLTTNGHWTLLPYFLSKPHPKCPKNQIEPTYQMDWPTHNNPNVRAHKCIFGNKMATNYRTFEESERENHTHVHVVHTIQYRNANAPTQNKSTKFIQNFMYGKQICTRKHTCKRSQDPREPWIP